MKSILVLSTLQSFWSGLQHKPSEVIYNISVVPTPLVFVPMRFTEFDGAQTIVSYNTIYSVSVVPQCQNTTATIGLLNLHYGELIKINE